MSTVADLIEELLELPADAPVMVAVIKKPSLMNGDMPTPWYQHDTVECVPLERGDLSINEGVVHIALELTDFVEELTELTEELATDD